MIIKSSYVYFVDAPPSMPEITSGPLHSAFPPSNTPFKEQLKILIWVVVTLLPLLPGESLEFREELFDPV
jgi:hypothetical protein